MDLQSACASLHCQKVPCSTVSRCQPHQVAALSLSAPKQRGCRPFGLSNGNIWIQNHLKLKSRLGSGVVVRARNSEKFVKSEPLRKEIRDVRVNAYDGSEPLCGKPGSVSFVGVTHQSVDEGKLVSSPVEENARSIVWIVAPVALIASLMLPRFILGSAIEELFRNEVLSEIINSFISEMAFYIGLATFLHFTESVQKPYLQFSAKRWSLITGLKGYISSAFFVMGFKIFAPLLAVYVTWPVLGLPVLVAVAPFLVGCLVQFVFEKFAESRNSSSWPLIPIIFEVYRIYQLTLGVHFLHTMMYAMKDSPITSQLIEKNGALVSMIVTFQILGVFSLWSLLTFLLRLFPSRPVAENY
ncbi:OLC1v1017834C1 [Oldenlandia corymbosa var. corymbosa]|uniref:OLC1v1017834C1 n=1 Tax=Oldenlandia corymbosa var. corymbosa TaxID=529605 RepID=A0AAV1EAC8_OLDCO|nr:OLC1v1017834C1 [Oldenlandia corymbosa var. corymbosa]